VARGDEFLIVGSSEQLMLWCENQISREIDMKDIGVWQVLDEVFLEQG